MTLFYFVFCCCFLKSIRFLEVCRSGWKFRSFIILVIDFSSKHLYVICWVLLSDKKMFCPLLMFCIIYPRFGDWINVSIYELSCLPLDCSLPAPSCWIASPRLLNCLIWGFWKFSRRNFFSPKVSNVPYQIYFLRRSQWWKMASSGGGSGKSSGRWRRGSENPEVLAKILTVRLRFSGWFWQENWRGCQVGAEESGVS